MRAGWSVVAAQPNDDGPPATRLIFERLSVEQGLSQSSVNCLLQDRQGFIWIGTEDGLNRYDGVGFTVLRPLRNDPNSLPYHYISALHEDRDGFLWIGTYGGGLTRLDRDRTRFERHSSGPNDADALGRNYVTAITEDALGVLWVGTSGGLDAYDHTTRRLIEYRAEPARPGSLSSNSITALHVDRAGTLWVGTDRGLNRFERESGQLHRLSQRSGRRKQPERRHDHRASSATATGACGSAPARPG